MYTKRSGESLPVTADSCNGLVSSPCRPGPFGHPHHKRPMPNRDGVEPLPRGYTVKMFFPTFNLNPVRLLG